MNRNAQSKKLLQSQPKKERFPTNPLRGLSTRSSGSSSCSNVSGSESEADQRFLLSHSFSSSSSTGVFPPRCSNRPVRSVAKTPKSAPVVVSKPLIRKKCSVSVKPNLQRCKTNSTSVKRVTSSKVTMKQEKGSILRKAKLRGDSIAQVNTPVSKLGKEADENVDDGRLDYRERTPPVQASVSPEILCGSSMSLSVSAQSQACYAAGHLLSGVSDKRKCKPKGILTVGKGKILNDSDEFEEGDFGGKISVIPLPVDASEQWLLSPCDEEERLDDGLVQFQQVVDCVGSESPSPLSDRSTSSDLCNISSGRSLSPMNVCKETVRRISSSLSPDELSRFRRFIHLSSSDGLASPFDTKLDPSEHLKGKQSPLSVDTLGSENVMQTPESNSSFDSYLRLLDSPAEIQKKLDVGSDLESLTTTLHSTRLSPRSHTSPQELSISSFKFDSFAATSSDSVDLSQFHRGVERISRHTDTKFDIRNHKESAAPQGKGREKLPCSTAESISIDGGSLICSEDSNWMACYKS